MPTNHEMITTRPSSESDREYARTVHHSAYRDVVQRQFGNWDENQQDDYFEKAWTTNAHEILLGDGEPCGYVSVKRDPDSLTILEVVIDSQFQNQGIGSAYIASIQKEASNKGVPLMLEVLTHNRARALYERLGFLEYSQTDTHVQMRWNDRSREVIERTELS